MIRSFVLAALLVLLAAVPARAAGLSCSSGGTVYDRGGVRLFETDAQKYWACSATVRRPRLLVDYGEGGNSRIEHVHRTGNRVAFGVLSFGEESSGWEIGWFDARNGKVVHAGLSEPNNDTGPEVEDLALAADGGIAAVTGRDPGLDDDRTIYYRPFAGGKLGAQRKLATMKQEDILASTIAFGGPDVTWRTRGTARSVALDASPTPPPPARAAAARPAPSCRAGVTVVEDYVRLFNVAGGSRRGLWTCDNDAKRPRATRVGPVGKIGLVASAGTRQAFEVLPGPGYPNGAVAVFESRLHLLRLRQLTSHFVVALVLVRGGGVAYAAAPSAAGYALTVLDADGSRFAAPRVVREAAPDEFEPATLRATPTALTWSTVGQPRSAPL